ncbi:MAG: hypothetical protein ABJB55_10505 [Actinomycetota bacterium]
MRRWTVVLATLLIAALMVVHVAVRSQAVPPGNRGDIAFASNRAGNYDIYTMDPGTGTVSAAIQTAANERAPAWNPDGTKLAFVRENTTTCTPLSCWDLYVRDTVASTTTKLTSFGAGTQLFDTTWSTDGTRLAFTKMDTVSANDIYVVPANGSTGPAQVTATSVAESSPDWSPDSTQLVMSNGGHLFTIASTAVAGTPTQVTLSGSPPAYAKDASWGPDGRFAFVGGTSKFLPISIYTANSDGSAATQVWNAGGGTINTPAWAPDGSRITFAYVASGTDYDIGVLRLCSGAVNYPAPNALLDIDPNWQPVLPAPDPIPPSCASPSPTVSPSVSVSTSSTTSTSSSTTTTTSTSSSSSTTTSTSSSTSSSPPPTPPSGRHVSITDGGFDGSRVSIKRGGTVVWDSIGTMPRGAADVSPMSLWDTGLLPVASSGWKTFVAASVYRYDDPADAGHSGAIVVPLTASPGTGRGSTTFTVTWASKQAPTGFGYDVQIRRPGKAWRSWKALVTRAAASFRADSGRGTYRFRARLVKLAGGHAGWSPADAVRIG